MDLTYSDADNAFRMEVRDYIAKNLPARISNKVKFNHRLTKADLEEWHAILAKKGYLNGPWPKEFGGQGWSAVQRHVFDEELSAAFAPRIIPFGLNMLGPVLMKFGTPEQQKHYLPRIVDGTDWWCQGYSEPGAGSDLASLKTRAVREGDHYIVNGQKTWTTLGQYADWIFCLVRTDTSVKQQEGISFLLIDMKTPGITVRPIILLEGEHEVNDVFFDNVKVPVENLVGPENKGWTLAKYLLVHERTGIAGVGASTTALHYLKEIARKEKKNGKPLIEDPYFAARLAQIEIDLDAMRTTNLRALAQADAGGAPGPETSMLKIKGTVIRQALNDLTRRALGPYASPFLPDPEEGANAFQVGPDYAHGQAADYFNNRKISIFGGSNEIQRGIITKAILGL